MPGGDRTGPWGAGPMTGRGAGYCAGYSGPGYANPVPPLYGRGRGGGGRGRGGHGWRHRYYATGMPGRMRAGYGPWPGPYAGPYGPPQAEPIQETGQPGYPEDREILQQQAQFLQEQLNEINQRLSELEGEKTQPEDQTEQQ